MPREPAPSLSSSRKSAIERTPSRVATARASRRRRALLVAGGDQRGKSIRGASRSRRRRGSAPRDDRDGTGTEPGTESPKSAVLAATEITRRRSAPDGNPGQPRDLASSRPERPFPRRFTEARGEDDRCPEPRSAASASDAGTFVAVIATPTMSTGRGTPAAMARNRGRARSSRRVNAPDTTGEARPLQIPQNGVAVGARPVGGADDGHRARIQQRGWIGPVGDLAAH